jgi:nitric oxide reductase NorQ protein
MPFFFPGEIAMKNKTLRVISEEVQRTPTPNDNVLPEPSDGFVNTSYVEDVTERALAYLEVGYPVHFSGPAGTGKTTLAYHIAAQLGRPVTLIHGDDEFGSSDLIGRDSGYRKYSLYDNFIHSVLKTEEHLNTVWEDNRLTTACENGYTLIYDEFTRSRAEANNALLSVLEEGVLDLPKLRKTGNGYMRVHRDFRAIFTSNPEEYAGVHKTQDALMDRLITINLGHFDRETEVRVAIAKSGLEEQDAETIVDIVREIRGIGVNNNRPTVRASIAIARIVGSLGRHARTDDPIFVRVCRDVLNTDTAKVTRGGQALMPNIVWEVIQKVCGNGKKQAGNSDNPQIIEHRKERENAFI